MFVLTHYGRSVRLVEAELPSPLETLKTKAEHMFSWLLSPKPPKTEVGRVCFTLINRVRASKGHNIRNFLPASLGSNSEFIGILIGFMQLGSTPEESQFVVSNIQDLFEALFGLKANSDSWSDGMTRAMELLQTGGNNEELVDSMMRTQTLMLDPSTLDNDALDQLVAPFF